MNKQIIMNTKKFKQPFASYITVYAIGNQIKTPKEEESYFGVLYNTPQELIYSFEQDSDIYLGKYPYTYYIIEMLVDLAFVYDEMENKVVEQNTPIYQTVKWYNIDSFKKAYQKSKIHLR